MPLVRASLQTLGAVVLLALTLACGGKSGNNAATTTASVTGTVTYLRVPLATDAQGKPTGLLDASVATNLKSLPARGAMVRAYQLVDQTDSKGNVVPKWILAQISVTDAAGLYSLSLTKGRPTMVEILSTFGNGSTIAINVLAEPDGINSPTGVHDRWRYAVRKAVNGTAPAGDNAPNSALVADAVVNFSVGLNDPWWVVNPDFNFGTQTAPFVDQAVLETTLPGRTAGLGSGSRILGIGDTIYSFLTAYSVATPGTTLDLHYWPGRSEPLGSYIDYGPYGPQRFPQAFDASTGRYHFFGSLRGDAANDDAWDEGVILPLVARGTLFAGNAGRTYSVPLNPIFPPAAALTDLSPDLARMEGLAEAMAANVLKSPYLADTQGTALVSLVDLRDISSLTAAQKSPFSAPALRAFSWELILKANSLPSPGVATDWANINALAAARFFLAPGFTGTSLNGTTRDSEPLNIFSQLGRLKEGKNTAEPVDLAAVFTDPVLTTLGAPFGIPWPRPTTGAYAAFAADWGTDPTGPFPVVVLSAAKGLQGEVFYAGFNLSADKHCVLTATISPALGAGAVIDLDLPQMLRTFSFTGSGGTTGTILIPVGLTAPVYHPVRLWLKNPPALQADVTVTLTLTPVP